MLLGFRSISQLWLALAVAACGSSTDGAEEAEASGPLYLAASWVADNETTNTYVATTTSLEAGRLDFERALEIPGYGDAWVFEGQIFISDGESPKVGRYTLDASGGLVLDTEVSFANYGVSGTAFWEQQFLSPTKAYLSNAGGREYIVWDPSRMEITGTVAWPEISFDDGLEVFNSYTDRGGVVVNGNFFHGLYAHDEDFFRFGDRSVVAVFDVETDALVTTIDVPCPMMDVASLGDDGSIYVSGWSYMPLSYIAGYSPKNCAARIDPRTLELDASWMLDYAEIGEGEQGSGLRAVSGDDGIFAVFHGSDVEVVEDMDIWDLDAGEADWELHSIDLATRDVEPTGITMDDGSYYESHIDGRYFVYLQTNLSDTQVYERTADGYEPRFSGAGWMSRLFRLR